MPLVCPHCRAAFEVADRRPSFCAFCGKPLPADETPSATDLHMAVTEPPETVGVGADDAPQQVGGYRLVRPLGRGGMGAVYEAEEVATGRRVALKLLVPEFAASPSAVERFRREGQLASRIIHPRCVFVLAADEDAGRPYIVMELMPGETLKDLVEREGPLPPARAVELMLDVLAGLRETHRLGLIHRDVKPSNCFLEADGRVKVGDFGLAKSLAVASELTRPGTFVGTVVFASPEQVRNEGVDARTDVYSAAATLYYLLTGRAPFESGDALATMARIVSDDPPSLRQARPDVSDELDRAVLRGLARNPARRWRSAEDFEAALASLLPGFHSPGRLGIRFAAHLLDWLVLSFVLLLFLLLYKDALAQFGLAAFDAPPGLDSVVLLVTMAGLYFLIPEWLRGCSPGKLPLGLRVRRAESSARPGFPGMLLRTGVWLFPVILLLITIDFLLPDPDSTSAPLYCLFLLASLAPGVFVLIAPMRKRNGYRGLHEWLSGTRVVTLTPREPTREPRKSSPRPWRLIKVASETPAAIGPFRVTGCWAESDAERFLMAEDPKLQRAVCVRLCDRGEPVSLARREATRPARPRWLAGGDAEGRPWDAFVAPVGRPLSQVVWEEGPMNWKDLRPLLEQLAEELDAAAKDETLPAPLTVGQVMVRPGGVELLDFSPGASARSGLPPAANSDPLTLLREVVVLALGVAGSGRRLRMPPLPEHAARLVRKLLAEEPPYRSVAEVLRDLEATRERPIEVTRGLRAAQLVVVGLGLLSGHQAAWFALLDFASPGGENAAFVKFFSYLLPFWMIWAALWRGGLGLRLFGLTLLGPDGRIASPQRCAWRAFLIWAPVSFCALFIWVIRLWAALSHNGEMREELDSALIGFGFLVVSNLPIVYLALGLWRPQRSLFDWLAGTYVVPK